MSPDIRISPEIPVETAQAARRIYNIQHVYLRIGDELTGIQSSVNITYLDSTSSLNPESALRLGLVTAFQFAEDLPDQAAAIASMKRMDWKYALHLPVKHPGFPPASLCAFRQSLIPSQNGLAEFSRMLNILDQLGLFAWANSGDPLEAETTLAVVCMVTRLSNLKLRMKTAISTLATSSPAWMRTHALPYWYHRYSTSALAHPARSNPHDLIDEADHIGRDVQRLLSLLPPHNILDAASQAVISSLQHCWEEEFITSGNTIHWRLPGCSTCPSRTAAEIN